ncbi:MAG: recombinase family protein [Clostridia bacterium]|nr:recombinase family protein [Clostridia bacterium]
MNNMVFGYVRISSADQNEERQLEELRKAGVDERNIYIDKKSGKDFDREQYRALVDRLREGDLVVVASLDRLGRNYIEIQKEWQYITQDIKADVKILDMPLLDTSTATENLDRRFIADLVLQILCYTAEKERENIRRRQREGIDVMPIVDGKRVSAKTGRPTGRPRAVKPENWMEVYTMWTNKEITAVKAMEILNLKPNTFYRFANEEKETIII